MISCKIILFYFPLSILNICEYKYNIDILICYKYNINILIKYVKIKY